ncbi:MAG: 5'/3'-nucleotidase SurE [Spirochaetia bacterium]|nr:5'/3'-nucleotidase SurE [Spirochaetia bacterium]
MKILLVNDDGINASGLKALDVALSVAGHDVMVVAPETQRSGFSSSITFVNDVILRKIDDRHYGCSGTPVDCCHRALLGAVDFIPDLVISGINSGPNVGTDIIYSGTTGGARQAAFLGYPAVAVSVNAFSEPFYFDIAAEFVVDNLERFIDWCENEYFINVNIPASPEKLDFDFTFPAKITYSNEIKTLWEEDSLHTILRLTKSRETQEEGSDAWAVNHGKISVSKVYIYPVADMRYDKMT